MKQNKKTDLIDIIPNRLIKEIGRKASLELTPTLLNKYKNLALKYCRLRLTTESFLYKAYKFHARKVKIDTDNIGYQHLVIAEVIWNCNILSKQQYLKKCKEFKVDIFIDEKKININR